jgi:TPR repeat protein
MYRVIVTILVVGLSTVAVANDNIDQFWNDFNKAIIKNDCETALFKLDHLIKLDPNLAYAQKASLYEKGRCLPLDIDKAILNYQMVPKEKLDGMFALNLTHLLFTQAQTSEEKQIALSGIRDILFDHIILIETANELESYVRMLYPNSPTFLSALKGEFDFFHSIDKKPDFKLLQAEKLLIEVKFLDVAEYWLGQLTGKNLPKADYLFAKYFDGKLEEFSGHLRYAAIGGIPEAQLALAHIYEKEATKVSLKFSYFWFLKAQKNTLEVDDEIQRVRSQLSKADIQFIEGEVPKEHPAYY